MSENKDKLVDIFNKAAEFVNSVTETIEKLKEGARVKSCAGEIKQTKESVNSRVKFTELPISVKAARSITEETVNNITNSGKNHNFEIAKKDLENIFASIRRVANDGDNLFYYYFHHLTTKEIKEAATNYLLKSGYSALFEESHFDDKNNYISADRLKISW